MLFSFLLVDILTLSVKVKKNVTSINAFLFIITTHYIMYSDSETRMFMLLYIYRLFLYKDVDQRLTRFDIRI